MPITPELQPGDQIYKYLLDRRIGAGGFGEIWLANDLSVNSQVALKILDSSRVSIEQHIQEAERGHMMDHSNLIKIHYADATTRHGIRLFLIAMDYLPNGSVVGHLNASNFLPIKTALPIIADVLRGLEFLHEQNMYHNDIKPNNILLGDNGEGVLTDYGISVSTIGQSSVTPSGAYGLHKAPELIESGQINAQTDLYQLGLTLFRLTNGNGKLRAKLDSIGGAQYHQLIQNGQLITAQDYLPFIPSNLKRLISKATHSDPSQRFQSPLEMRRQIERLNFSGDWTVNTRGEYMGLCSRYEYRFEIQQRPDRKYDLTSYKKNKKTNNERRVRDFCVQSATKAETNRVQKKFMQAVVGGL